MTTKDAKYNGIHIQPRHIDNTPTACISNTTLSSFNNGQTFTNAGASGMVTWTLPEAKAGMRFRFVRIDADAGEDIRIEPHGADKIYMHERHYRSALDPDELGSGDQECYSRYVSGAAFGDIVEAAFSHDLGKLFISAYISGDDWVRIALGNIDAGAGDIDLDEGILDLIIHKRGRWSPGSGKYIGSHADVDDYVALTFECFKDGEWTVIHQMGRLEYES